MMKLVHQQIRYEQGADTECDRQSLSLQTERDPMGVLICTMRTGPNGWTFDAADLAQLIKIIETGVKVNGLA